MQLDEFENLCSKAHDLHYQLYPWARMSPTVHKLLIHSSDIIRQFPLPIAYYSEDASESWHKIYRQNLVSHARQISREARILDTFNRAVYVTDPVISLIYIKNRLKGQWENQLLTKWIDTLDTGEYIFIKKFLRGKKTLKPHSILFFNTKSP